MSVIDEILNRWPLQSMCARLGLQIPERGKFHSPFRNDQNPSCTVYQGTIRDWSTGEIYDTIRVFAEIKGLSNSDAIKQLAQELPGRQRKVRKEKPILKIPETHWTDREIEALGKLRRLDVAGIHLARTLGTLRFATVGGFECWLLLDGSRKLAEARRLDGQPFPAIGKLEARKSHTLKGSCKSWPLGITLPQKAVPETMPVVIVEGAPDYLAACSLLFHAVQEFLPVAMMGASQSINKAALPFFRGRNVLILGHPDQAGFDAATRWGVQLKTCGAIPSARQLEGGDLNDLVTKYGSRAVLEDLGL